MNKIIGIGANVYDTLITLPNYPKEDTKMQCKSIKMSGGGPCATGLVAACKLGASCVFAGNIADDAGGRFLQADFDRFGVKTDLLCVMPGCNSFSSFIWLGMDNASRTCVFDKGNLPATRITDVVAEAIKQADVLMVDGNDLEAAIQGAKIAKQSATKVLYDAGGLYEGIEELLPLADILIPSEEFALAITKTDSAEEAAKVLYENYKPDVVVVTQGKKGGVLFDGKETVNYPVLPVSVVDSNGAGDVFHGAFAFAVTKGYDYYDACVFSSAVSALKCTKVGARDAVPTFDETVKFLKECGYDEF